MQVVSLRRQGKPLLCCPLSVAFCCLLNSHPGFWARRDATNHLVYCSCFTVEGIRTPRCEPTSSNSILLTGGSADGPVILPPEPQSRACPTAYRPSPCPRFLVYWWWCMLKLGLLVWEERSEVGDKRGAGWVPLVCFPEEYEDAWTFQMYFLKGNVSPNKHEAFIRLRYGLLNHNVDNFQIWNVECGNTPFQDSSLSIPKHSAWQGPEFTHHRSLPRAVIKNTSNRTVNVNNTHCRISFPESVYNCLLWRFLQTQTTAKTGCSSSNATSHGLVSHQPAFRALPPLLQVSFCLPSGPRNSPPPS